MAGWRDEAVARQQRFHAQFGSRVWWSGHARTHKLQLQDKLAALLEEAALSTEPKLVARLRGLASKVAKHFECEVHIAVVFVCLQQQQQLECRPVLRVQGAERVLFMDSSCRVYGSWTDFLYENDLPKCQLCSPVNGRYMEDSAGVLRLEFRTSPASRWRSLCLLMMDVVFLSLALLGLATGVIVQSIDQHLSAQVERALDIAAITCIAAAAAYNILRSVYVLYDMVKHF